MNKYIAQIHIQNTSILILTFYPFIIYLSLKYQKQKTYALQNKKLKT